MFLLDPNKIKELEEYLHQQKWLASTETVNTTSKAGEGNMNCVLRVGANTHSLIIKQSRAYVEKYPQIAAPANRVITEGFFYQKISPYPGIKQMMPGLTGVDEINNIIALEDLGEANDYTFLYDLKKNISNADIIALVTWLHELHLRLKRPQTNNTSFNREMKLLNHEHIFNYPFLENNGFNLDAINPGLQAISLPYKNDPLLKDKLKNLGSLYLSEGQYLLHGDFYPGSWLKTNDGIKIIDAEFCFYGPREFDLGILLAHLYLTKHEETVLQLIKSSYPAFAELNSDILNGFTGTEIMRRIMGLAQLPLKLTLEEKERILKKGYSLIMQ